MRHLSYIIPLILISYSSFSYNQEAVPIDKKPYYTINASPLTEKQKAVVIDGEVYARSNVNSFKSKIKKIKKQRFNFMIAGLHKKSCRYALNKLKYYENYKDYLGFVQNSSYTEKTKRVYFRISHSLLPIDMVLHFVLPRIEKPGIYPFMFDIGFLKGLNGQIHVSKYKKSCYFFATAKWEGPHTGFADTLFEFFSKGMGVLALENLFRISGGI